MTTAAEGTGGGDGGGPSIAIVSPAAMTFANGDVAIKVQVSGGTAAKVQLLRNDMAWQELSGPPFRFTWDTRPAADGDYILTASAMVGGKLVTSAPITVSVDHTPPEVIEVTPARGKRLRRPGRADQGDVLRARSRVDRERLLGAPHRRRRGRPEHGGPGVRCEVVDGDNHRSQGADAAGGLRGDRRHDDHAIERGTPWRRSTRRGRWTVPAWIKLPPLATEMPPRLAIDATGRPLIIYVVADTVSGNGVLNIRVARFDGGAWDTSMGAPTHQRRHRRKRVLRRARLEGTASARVDGVRATVHGISEGLRRGLDRIELEYTVPGARRDQRHRNGSGFSVRRIGSVGSTRCVAWREQTGSSPTYDAYAARWDGAAWVRLNGSGFMGGAGFSRLLDGPQLVVDAQGNPMFGWSESGVGTGVSFWTGTDWMRSQPQLGGYTPYPALDSSGTPWLAVKSADLHVVRWDRTMLNWPEATTALTTSASWSGPRLALAPNGSPVVAWLDTSSGVRIGVARWTGTAWDTKFGLFNAGQNPANNIVPELVVDARGKIWVAWREGTAAQVWASNY